MINKIVPSLVAAVAGIRDGAVAELQRKTGAKLRLANDWRAIETSWIRPAGV